MSNSSFLLFSNSFNKNHGNVFRMPQQCYWNYNFTFYLHLKYRSLADDVTGMTNKFNNDNIKDKVTMVDVGNFKCI